MSDSEAKKVMPKVTELWKLVDYHSSKNSNDDLGKEFDPATAFDIMSSLSEVVPEGTELPNNYLSEHIPISFFEEMIICLGFFFGLGVVAYQPLTLIICLFFARKWLIYVIAILMLFAFLPISPSFPPRFTYSRGIKMVLRYFSTRIVFTKKISPDQKYIFIAPPHGTIPFGNFISLALSKIMFGFSFYGLTASVVLKIPILRQFVSCLGCVDASAWKVRKLLEENNSVGICPGGIAEMFENPNPHSSNEEVIILKPRAGYVKLALTTGTPIVPFYVFGNTVTFYSFMDPWGILQGISRRLRVAITIGWGRFGLPIPIRVPIAIIMGEPILVEKNDNPSFAEIEELKQTAINAVQDLFDKHKAAYGWSHKTLIIK